jgi:hypothetical protein
MEKLCIDCKFCEAKERFSKSYICSNGKLGNNVVDGKRELIDCFYVRSCATACGLEGNWFESKIDKKLFNNEVNNANKEIAEKISNKFESSNERFIKIISNSNKKQLEEIYEMLNEAEKKMIRISYMEPRTTGF